MGAVVDRSRWPVVTVSVEEPADLDALAKTGKFGKNASEAGEELLRLKLREIELEGWLVRARRPKKR